MGTYLKPNCWASACRNPYASTAHAAPDTSHCPSAIPLICAHLILRLLRADEGTHELAFNLRSQRVHVDTLPREEGARVFYLVGARGLDLDGFESRCRELRRILRVLQC